MMVERLERLVRPGDVVTPYAPLCQSCGVRGCTAAGRTRRRRWWRR